MVARRKTDGNAAQIAMAFRGLGCSVEFVKSASGKSGIPDLVIGCSGATFLVEVKALAWKEGPIHPDTTAAAQKSFRDEWRGAPVERAQTFEDVGAMVKKWRNGQ